MPHWTNPFRCEAFEAWPDRAIDRGVDAEVVAAFDDWLDANPSAVARCWYHGLRLIDGMQLAVHVIEDLGATAEWWVDVDGQRGGVVDAVARAGNHTVDVVDAAVDLLRSPITWLDGTDYLTDGQHRMCVMRRSSLARIAVCVK